MANEFHNLNLSCSPNDIVPRGADYTDSQYQTCLLTGSAPGSVVVSGDAYLDAAFDFHYDKIWFNLGIMAVQALVFLVVGVVATEFLHFAPGGTRRVWARTQRVKRMLQRQWYKQDDDEASAAADGSAFSLAPIFDDGGAETSSLEEADEDGDDRTEVEPIKGSTLLVSHQSDWPRLRTCNSPSFAEFACAIQWRNVCLWVDTAEDTRRLLDHVSGHIKPGRVCALMGASGAGKSTRECSFLTLSLYKAHQLMTCPRTVLNVLAGRKIGVVRGQILVDGVKPDEEFYRTTGFVEQFDLHGQWQSWLAFALKLISRAILRLQMTARRFVRRSSFLPS